MLPNMVSSTLSRSSPLPPVRAGQRKGRDALRPAARMFHLASKHVPKYTGYVPGRRRRATRSPDRSLARSPARPLSLSPPTFKTCFPLCLNLHAAPGLKNTFGITFGDASQTMLDAVRNRDEGTLQVSYSPTAPVRKLQCSRSLVGGPSMHGLVEPHASSPGRLAPLPAASAGESRLGASDCEPALHTHLQGSAVDTAGYYEFLIKDDYKGLRVKTAWDPRRQGPPSVKGRARPVLARGASLTLLVSPSPLTLPVSPRAPLTLRLSRISHAPPALPQWAMAALTVSTAPFPSVTDSSSTDHTCTRLRIQRPRSAEWTS